MSEPVITKDEWQKRWKKFAEAYGQFEKRERELGKLWSQIPNATEYFLDRMELAEAKVTELEAENRTVHGCAVQWHQMWLLFMGKDYDQSEWLAEYKRVIDQAATIERLTAVLVTMRDSMSVSSTPYFRGYLDCIDAALNPQEPK